MAATTVASVESDQNQPRRWMWTRDLYHLAGKQGIFRPDERVELINGEVYHTISPIGSRHAAAIHKIAHVLDSLLGPAFFARTESPLVLSDISEPEPDVCLVPRRDDSYAETHPVASEAVLVIEVADTTLRFDSGKKLSAYAAAGIPEYWILDLNTDRLTVLREPNAWGEYGLRQILTSSDMVLPLAAPEKSLAVADLLPGAT